MVSATTSIHYNNPSENHCDTHTMALPVQQLEGKYEIVAKIKEGGMGAIYRVRHRLLDEIRVVKVLRPQLEKDSNLKARFAHEARAAIQLKHPNIVQIFDYSVDPTGIGCIVMEHIDGIDLRQLIAVAEPPSLRLALEIARQALRALAYLHNRGFVHRDLSPDNLMLTLDVDHQPLVKIIDLGIAKRRDSTSQLTVSGSFLGKFRYSSPEHFGSEGPGGVNAQSDLYAFGVVLYELITGCYPIAGESTSQLIAGHLFQEPMSFADSDPAGKIPSELRQAVMRALAKRPDDRFAQAADFAQAIAKLQRRFPLEAEQSSEAGRFAALGARVLPSATPGSTQAKLDQDFGAGATPLHIDSGSALEDIEREVGELLAGAESLERERRSEQARLQAQAALSLAPENTAAKRLVAQLSDKLPTLPPTSSALPSPPTPTAEAPSPDKPASSYNHLAAALEATERGNFSRASQALERVLDQGPGDSSVEALLSDSQKRLAAEQETSAIERECVAIRKLIEHDDLETAESQVLVAESRFGRRSDFTQLSDEIAEHHRRRVSDLIGAAGRAFEAADLPRAATLLRRAHQLEPEDDWIRARLRQAEAGQTSRSPADTSLAEIKRLRAAGESVAAWQRLKQLLDTGSEDPRLEQLQRQLAREILGDEPQ